MSIINFTEAAIAHIKQILKNHPKGSGFRLSIKETGCSGYMYMPEIVQEPKNDDIQLSSNQVSIFIDPKCVHLIKGSKVDYVKKNLGMSQLVFNNPNAEGLCGCGESFKLKES